MNDERPGLAPGFFAPGLAVIAVDRRIANFDEDLVYTHVEFPFAMRIAKLLCRERVVLVEVSAGTALMPFASRAQQAMGVIGVLNRASSLEIPTGRPTNR